jgi:hypothetical protein
MQNHEKKRFNNTSSVGAMAAIAIGAMLIFSVAGTKAFADTIENTIAADVTKNSIVEGGSTTATYWVKNGDPADPQNQCNAADGTSVTITVTFPSGVKATVGGTEKTSPFTLTFDKCGEGNGNDVTFSSTTAGTYSIRTTDIVDKDSTNPIGTYTDNSDFTLTVTEPAAPDDVTEPVITADIVGTKNGDWYTTDVTVSWTVVEEESPDSLQTTGCDTTTISTDTTGTDITCSATSDGGESSETVTIRRDATAPTVSLVVGDNGIAAGGSYFFGFVPSQPTCEASDPTPGSGLDGECTVAGYGDSVGEHTVKATANDIAGNSGESESITYTVKKWELTGFYQPVDMGSTINTVKGGSTVPFKFDISAATEFTSTTFNGNPIGTFSAKKVSCTAGGEDAIEQVVTATGGTALRYDTTSGQFVYNWQTPKGAGICYDTTFTDQSGGTLTAHFKTK